jgi:hypothetical protein
MRIVPFLNPTYLGEYFATYRSWLWDINPLLTVSPNG